MKNRIRELREERNMTQVDLAEVIGVSRQTINAIETGKFDPSLTTAFKISLVFELPIEQLFFYSSE
jgi:putative transcriptional regulator